MRSMPNSIERGVARELLTERDGRRVHQVGAAALDDLGELLLLLAQRLGQVLERRDQVVHESGGRGDVDGRRETRRSTTATRSRGRSGGPACRASRVASVASTSLAFMFDDVPEPVWYTSIGN